MIQPFFNWRTGLAIIAIAIVSGTIIYSQLLAKKIAGEERQKVEQWVEAGKLAVQDTSGLSDRLVAAIITANNTIPIIETNEKEVIMQHVNLDSSKVANDTGYVKRQLNQFKAQNELPITWIDPGDSSKINFYYYGHTSLLNQVRYYPLVQLLIIALFTIITITALTTSFRSVQNRVWAGMAKETAHQLGTPLSSLQGWVEMMKDTPGNEKMVEEMSKDVDRLKLVSDRFGKIGSSPQLENNDIIYQVENMVEYIRKRAPGKVQFIVQNNANSRLLVPVSPPLFDWVIENLLKNALDAMDGKGSVIVAVNDTINQITIDVTDNGKGIARQNIGKVFKPGFTTKKRGWGLGLSLSKRIIDQYHKGQLFVKHSEVGKGTTFRIVLNK
ncbi:MAG: sensor histidine kinase [Chitinophagaceae bacterium]